MTHDDDKSLTEALLAARDAGRRCALATIVGTKGSTPRKVGARMSRSVVQIYVVRSGVYVEASRILDIVIDQMLGNQTCHEVDPEVLGDSVRSTGKP